MSISVPPSRPELVAMARTMEQAAASRTPEATARAVELSHDGTWRMWVREASALSKSSNLGVFGRAKVFGSLGASLGVTLGASAVMKLAHNQPRPYQVNPAIVPVGRPPTGTR